jgi:hypothetical protein
MPGPLCFRFRVPRPPRLLRVRRGAPDSCRGHSSGLGRLFNRCPSVPVFSVRGRERDLSCFLAIHPIPLPGSQTPAGPAGPRHLRSCRCCPRLTNTEGSSVERISRLNPGLWYPLPTLHEPRCRRPCKARFRLAGCAFAGGVSNPLDRYERFQFTSILLSRTFHDAMAIPTNRRGVP